MPAKLDMTAFPRASTTAHELVVVQPTVVSDLGGASSGQGEKGLYFLAHSSFEGRTLLW